MTARAESPALGRAEATVLDLTKACITKFEGCTANVAMENRLADLRLWADGVGAIAEGKASLDSRFLTRPDDLMLVKTILIMLGDFLDDYADLVEDDQPVDDAIHHVDSAIENLVMIGVAVRRTGKASRRRRAEMLFDPAEYEELRRHLECIILLRPSEAGVQSQLDSSSLTATQKRLIDGNLRRRHRFVVAQKHSRQLREAEGKGTSIQDAFDQSKTLQEAEQPEYRASEPLAVRPRPGRKERAPPTKAGFTAASTAEGSLLYAPGRRFTTGDSRTQITALAADAEFPMPPRNPSGRLIGKCPCCCQSLPVEEMMNPNKWRQHIVEDLCPYTCIIEHCPAPHLLFSTRKDWEAHVKADHKTEWHCPLCENQDLVFPTEGDIIDHFKAQHPEDVQNLTLSTLLPWSETQRMGITSCPLCPSFGREDSPEIVSHVLRHVYEFSMRALPWPKPATHDLANPVGQHVLPDNSEDAGRLVRWISIVNSDSVNSDVQLQLQLSNLDAISYVGAELEETVDEASYVLDEEYFDDASVDESEKPQGALTEPSKRSSPSQEVGEVEFAETVEEAPRPQDAPAKSPSDPASAASSTLDRQFNRLPTASAGDRRENDELLFTERHLDMGGGANSLGGKDDNAPTTTPNALASFDDNDSIVSQPVSMPAFLEARDDLDFVWDDENRELSEPWTQPVTEAGLDTHKHKIFHHADKEYLNPPAPFILHSPDIAESGTTVVYRVRPPESVRLKSTLALKVILCRRERGHPSPDSKERKLALEELSIMSRIRHHHIVMYVASFEDYCVQRDRGRRRVQGSIKYVSREFIKKHILGIAMYPAAAHNLYTFMREFLEYPLDDAWKQKYMLTYFGCVAQAVAFLHSSELQLPHGYIKPENIIIDDFGMPILCDFGLSRHFERAHHSDDPIPKPMIYAAPESVQETVRDVRSDVFSLGAVYLELATVLVGKPPSFAKENIWTEPGDFKYADWLENIPGYFRLLRQLGDERIAKDSTQEQSTKALLGVLPQIERMMHPSSELRPYVRDLFPLFRPLYDVYEEPGLCEYCERQNVMYGEAFKGKFSAA